MTMQNAEGEVPQWTLGDRLVKARRVADVSTQDMADYFEVSRQTIRNYEADRSRPSRALLIAWALRCGVPVSWLSEGVMPRLDGPDGGATEAPAARRGDGNGASNSNVVTGRFGRVQPAAVAA